MLDLELHRLAHQALEQLRDFGNDVGQLQHLRPQRLLARESEQLPRQAGGAVRIGLDLLDVVIIAVAGRMAHQHQVAMPDDRGQDIVEIVRDAAGELADRLHLGRLRHLALEPGLLAIVLQAEQHRRIAQPARAGDRQRDRLVGMVLQPDRHVGRMRRAVGEAADRVGDRGLVLAHDQIARIERRLRGIDLRRADERVVHLDEAPVAIDQREPDRQQRDQAFDVRGGARADRRLAALLLVEQRDQDRRVVAVEERDLQDAQRVALGALALEPRPAPWRRRSGSARSRGRRRRFPRAPSTVRAARGWRRAACRRARSAPP